MEVRKRQPNSTDFHVGRRIKMRRKLLGLSQRSLADALGITFQQVQNYENGANRVGASRLQTIANVLNVPISFFFEDAPVSEWASMDNLGASSLHNVQIFPSSTECRQLNKAFLKIKNPVVRRRFLDLVRSLAEKNAEQ